ncbi:MAG: serine protease [Deltaproteobacteria bacterium]|nr:serine protease [Deltaproteobacteria bacterium]
MDWPRSHSLNKVRHQAVAVALNIVLLFGWGVPSVAEGMDFQRLLEETSPALVTVKFVLQVKFGGAMSEALGGDQEMDSEVTCVVIDPKGLILCSNTQFNGYVELMTRLMPEGFDVSATPKDLKVLVTRPPLSAGSAAEDKPENGSKPQQEELAASLIVRDSDRDLVWLRIDEPGQRPFSYLDLAQGEEGQVGQEVVAVYRLDNYFERTATLAETRIGGITERPRRLYIPSTALSAGLGAPVLDHHGKVVGLTVFQYPEAGEVEGGDNPLAVMSQNTRMQQGIQGLILPAAEIRRATAQVLALSEQEEE